ncbi:hypothetical protein CRG98_008368 [Punica granatum]|uniref:RNase H type-1 domain-containing protein n=1 Tax=Punica granatum TaxID=22663 RepID=A0A2I0KSC0_PUNGR|nr:hypothetical protein CRG98_008368 [Punica granatum]
MGLRWEPPPYGFYKLNSDGCSKGNLGLAGSGGLIRDSLGRWIIEYQMNLGHATSPIAELKARRQGLMIARDLGIGCLIVELDAQLVLKWVWGDYANKALTNLIDDCKTLCQHFDVITAKYTYRKANQSADHLANLGVELPNSLLILQQPPLSIRKLLFEDVMGFSFPRSVSALRMDT